MRDENEFATLLIDTWRDLQSPDVLWQILTLVLCLSFGWMIQRAALARVASRHDAEGGARRFGLHGLKRVLFPLSALVLVVGARAVLAMFHGVNLLNLAVPLLLSLALIRFLVFAAREAIGRATWFGGFERVFSSLAWFVVALHILGWLPEVIAGLKGVSFTFGAQTLSLWTLMQGAVMVLLTLLVALWAARALERRLVATTGLDDSVRLVLMRVAKAGLILIAILVSLPMVGIDLTTLSVFGGALGVGLGFGLQKIAANYVSGFIILLDHSIRIGSLITVGADRGVVSQITTRYTVIRAATGVESLVPNETLVGSVVQNETYSDTQVLVPLNFQISYGSDPEGAMAILEGVALAHERVLRDPAPKAFLVAFADSGINLRLSVWIADPRDGTLGVTSEINLSVWRKFRSEGIEIPFPQREVRLLRSAPVHDATSSAAGPAGELSGNPA